MRGAAPMHMTSREVPWISTTVAEPAPWCRPSMFCVMTPPSRPAVSSSASARWAAFGCGLPAQKSRRMDQARRRTTASRTYLAKVKSRGS